MKPNNPFLISGYYCPDYFCDRERETATIIDALHNGRNITLIAPRRIGKTGLINHAFYNINKQQPDIVTLYVDIFATQSLGDFVRLLANAVIGSLDTLPQKTFSDIAKFIRSCRPVLTVDELTGAPKLMLDMVPTAEKNTLKEIFDYIAASNKRCFIAIDEFQQIAEYPEHGVEALLRSYIQFLPNVNFIFAGSRQHVMHEMFTASNRPFYQSTQLLNIGVIDRDKYALFAIDHFAKHNTKLDEQTFNHIYDEFEGHTWYVQNMLNRLYSYAHDVDADLVAYAESQIVSELSYSYADMLRPYPVGSVRLLRAIANERCVKEPLSGLFISKHHLRAASSVSSALKRLLNNELVYNTPNGYIVYDRFMAQWLRQFLF